MFTDCKNSLARRLIVGCSVDLVRKVFVFDFGDDQTSDAESLCLGKIVRKDSHWSCILK